MRGFASFHPPPHGVLKPIPYGKIDLPIAHSVLRPHQAWVAEPSALPRLRNTQRFASTPMKALLLHLDGTAQTARTALGAVAGRDLRSLDGKRLLRKGQTVAENHLPVLAELHDLDLSLLIPEPGDVHEDEAAMRLGRAAAGPGVRVEGPKEAKARLVAEHR